MDREPCYVFLKSHFCAMLPYCRPAANTIPARAGSTESEIEVAKSASVKPEETLTVLREIQGRIARTRDYL